MVRSNGLGVCLIMYYSYIEIVIQFKLMEHNNVNMGYSYGLDH